MPPGQTAYRIDAHAAHRRVDSVASVDWLFFVGLQPSVGNIGTVALGIVTARCRA
ncbi:hypothetical protein P3W24_17555 [Luteibacter sp. PPL201]|jgi:hypothetical protein|uniref:Uncharacterized protein n=1 Tax=Luteibacter sahnii TaxID=3021977 RepID=A0ABT6BFD8_9GAMM|nr:hypothetical protein [Luteibacter sp. PPL193]MDY1549145.1 hypothetical protein [Luteibacter sp. PPL193]